MAIKSQEAPDYVTQEARKILDQFKGYQGTQLLHFMSDLVALSLNMLDEQSQMCEDDLETVKRIHYPQWAQDDFKLLLEILSEEDPHMKELIKNEQQFLSE